MEHYVTLQSTPLLENERQKAYTTALEAVQILYDAFCLQSEKLMQNEILDMESDLNLLKQTLQSENYQEYLRSAERKKDTK